MRFKTNQFLGGRTPMPIEQYQHLYDTTIVTISIQCFLLISFLKQEKFLKAMNIASSDIFIPSRPILCRRISCNGEYIHQHIKDLFKLLRSRDSPTTDAWYSSMNKVFIVILAHWVDTDWFSHSTILYFKQYPSPHITVSTHITQMGTIYK